MVLKILLTLYIIKNKIKYFIQKSFTQNNIKLS